VNTDREQFYKITKQYFQENQECDYQSETKKNEPEIKKFYIKEGPFINTNKLNYR